MELPVHVGRRQSVQRGDDHAGASGKELETAGWISPPLLDKSGFA
jgi:hypothetical protein